MPVARTCLVCKEPFVVNLYRVKMGWGKTCSMKCKYILRTGQTIPGRFPTCHPDRKHKGLGLCGSCYVKQFIAKLPDDRAEFYRKMKKFSSRVSRLASVTNRPFAEVRAEVETLLAKTDSCEICGIKKKLNIDHDHKTGRIRGLLCHQHNALLGFAAEDHDVLRNAIRYLMRKERECTA